MISTVVGRTLGVGVIAGALAGSLTTFVLVVGALLSPSGVGEWGWGTVISQGLVLLVVTALAGAVAGAIAGLGRPPGHRSAVRPGRAVVGDDPASGAGLTR